MKLFTKRNLIKPFNLDQEECREMFNAALPERLMVTISVLSSRDLTEECTQEIYSDIHDDLMALARECCGQAEQFGIFAELCYEHHFARNVLASLMPLDPLQKQWECRDMYVQVSFYDDSDLVMFKPASSTDTGMMLYDFGVAGTNSLNPVDHEPVEMDPKSAREYRLIMNDVYKEHIGIWTEGLVRYRTMIMVKVRALLAGLDPDQEYERFIEADGQHCFDYLMLCP